jgi:hypothetical protein
MSRSIAWLRLAAAEGANPALSDPATRPGLVVTQPLAV